MAKIDGSLIGVYVDGNLIAHGTGNSIDVSVDMQECTTKDSGGYKEYRAGEKGGTLSFEGMFDDAATTGYVQLFALSMAGTVVNVRWSSEQTGNQRLSSNALISNLSASAPQNDNTTFSCDFQLSGTITLEQVP